MYGKKNGEGKEFHSNGNMYYDGNYQNDAPHGDKVTTFHPNKQACYVGAMNEGQKEGHGTEFYESGQILFSGEWHQNEPYGENVQIYNNDGSVMFEGAKCKVGEDAVEVVTETVVETTTETTETVETFDENGVKTVTTVTTEVTESNPVESERVEEVAICEAPVEEESLIVTDTTLVTDAGTTTVHSEQTDTGMVTTSETITTEIVAINEDSGEELVRVTDTIEVIRTDSEGHVLEDDKQVVVEVDKIDIETGALIEVEVKDTITEVAMPCQDGVDIATTEVVEVLHHTDSTHSHVDIVTTTEVDHVDITTGEVTVMDQETVTECVGETEHITETVHMTEEVTETDVVTEVVTVQEDGTVTTEVTVVHTETPTE